MNRNSTEAKVRDVHTLEDGRLLMVASDRISAFDVVLPRPIPFKGQVLNQLAGHMLNAVSDLVPDLAGGDARPECGGGEMLRAHSVGDGHSGGI